MSHTSIAVTPDSHGAARSKSSRRALKLAFAHNIYVPMTYGVRSIDVLGEFLNTPMNRSDLRPRNIDKLVSHASFKNPQHQLHAGDRLNLRVYRIAHGHHLSPERCYTHWKQHWSLFSEAQTLAAIVHCIADKQISPQDLALGLRLIPPSVRFSSDYSTEGAVAPYMYVGADSALDIGMMCPNTTVSDDHALIVIERFTRR